MPIKRNRIVFSAHSGLSYKCSPKYIYQYLYDKYGSKYEYIWAIDNEELIPYNYRTKRVRYLSVKYIYYLITAHVIISNVGIEPFLPPRKRRVFINTWHGGGAYKNGVMASYYSKSHKLYFDIIRDLRAKSTDYIISSCYTFSKVFSDKFNVPINKMLPIGLPRNDMFFAMEAEKIKLSTQVYESLRVDEDKFLILYAPTYRGHERSVQKCDLGMNVLAVRDAIKKRFGKDVIFMFRCHMNMKKNYQSLPHAIDVSDYPDMQELLLIADGIITDYSSFIWDYALTYKPGFLYVPDLSDYGGDVQFHVPIDQWQYPYAKTIEELCYSILNYDETKAISKIKKHLALLGSYEKGTATKTVCDLIVKQLDS